MNKTTNKQKIIIDFFKTQLTSWENTNDINSPSHLSDIGEFARQLELSQESVTHIENVAIIMYQTIKKLND